MLSLDHLFLLLHFHLCTFSYHPFIPLSTIFNLASSFLVLFLPDLGGDGAIFPLHFDASGLEGDAHEMFLILVVSFLGRKGGTLESSFFSMKLWWRTSIIRWYLLLAMSTICRLRLRSTSRYFMRLLRVEEVERSVRVFSRSWFSEESKTMLKSSSLFTSLFFRLAGPRRALASLFLGRERTSLFQSYISLSETSPKDFLVDLVVCLDIPQ